MILPVIINLQGKMKRDFTRALYHGYLLIVSIALSLSVFLPIYHGWDISDFVLCLKISLYAFLAPLILWDLESLAILLFVPSILTFFFALACTLLRFRRCQTKMVRIGGQIVTFLAFGALYGCSYLLLVNYIFAAIAIGAMYSQ